MDIAAAEVSQRATTHNASTALLSLPAELLNQIFDEIDWRDARTLRQTCTALRKAVTVSQTVYKVKRRRAELWEADDGTYPAPCYACLRVLPEMAFPGPALYEEEVDRPWRERDMYQRSCWDCYDKKPAPWQFWGPPNTIDCRWSKRQLPVQCSSCRQIRLRYEPGGPVQAVLGGDLVWDDCLSCREMIWRTRERHISMLDWWS